MSFLASSKVMNSNIILDLRFKTITSIWLITFKIPPSERQWFRDRISVSLLRVRWLERIGNFLKFNFPLVWTSRFVANICLLLLTINVGIKRRAGKRFSIFRKLQVGKTGCYFHFIRKPKHWNMNVHSTTLHLSTKQIIRVLMILILIYNTIVTLYTCFLCCVGCCRGITNLYKKL